MLFSVILDAVAAVFAAVCIIALFSVSVDVVFYPDRIKENPFCLLVKRIINKNREER